MDADGTSDGHVVGKQWLEGGCLHPHPTPGSQHCTEFTIFDISIGSLEWEDESGEGKWDWNESNLLLGGIKHKYQILS